MLLWKRTVHAQQVSGRYPLSKPTDVQKEVFLRYAYTMLTLPENRR